METARKITVEVPLELLKKARQASGTGITQTVRTGLQLVAASSTYACLRPLRGKAPYRRCRNALRSAFGRDRVWLLAASGRVASEGAGEAPQGTPRRRANCPELHRPRGSSPHTRPGLPSFRRRCAPRSDTWAVNGL